MTDIGTWLDERMPRMPVELRREVDAAMAELPASTDPIPERLAEAGLAALARSIQGMERSTATDLLVADALLTYACEAAAEHGPVALDRLTAALDFHRFATLLEPDTR